MLKSIESNVFTKKIIKFNNSINIGLGLDGANSVGKTSFLKTIDFVFGGESLTKDTDIITHVGHHSIKANFEFNKEDKFFLLRTNDQYVYELDKNDEVLERLSLEGYRELLKSAYNIKTNFSFRQSMSIYNRFYGKGNVSYIYSYDGRGGQDKTSILALLDLMNYNDIPENIHTYNEKKYKKTVYNDALKIELINKPNTKKGLTMIKNDISSFEIELNDIDNEINNLITIDYLDEDKLNVLKEQLIVLLKERVFLKEKLKNIQNYKSSHSIPQNIFKEFKEIYGDSFVKSLKEIDNYHNKLANFLKDYASYESQNILNDLDETEKRITIINKTILLFENKDKKQILSNLLLDKKNKTILLSDLKHKIQYYNDYEDINIKVKKSQKFLKSEELQLKIKEINNKFKDTLKEDILKILKTSNFQISVRINSKYNISFDYNLQNNKGENADSILLILFDLFVLKNTNIPCISHDTTVLESITERNTLRLLFEKYNSIRKQSFITIANIDYFDKNTQDIIMNNTVLNISYIEPFYFVKRWSNQ